MNETHRRDFLKLFGLGIGATFASSLPGCGARAQATAGPVGEQTKDFLFLQVSDTHWGFEGPPNPDAKLTLPRAIEAINALERQPDFVVFTGDLTHKTTDVPVRRARMGEVKSMIATLKCKDVRLLAGEHDASQDGGDAFKELLGPLNWSFDHGGVHFVGLDNVSRAEAHLGDDQIAWLQQDLAAVAIDVPLVVFAHRPLFDLYPQWDWATPDAAKAIAIFEQRPATTVFYGHIHQEHHRVIGKVSHHAARSLMFPLPAPGSVPERAPLPWNAASADHGIGFRVVDVAGARASSSERAADGKPLA
jgi:3',5'-cyclic AMP phosphodiesterase CpdA